jgi:N-acetylglucosamine-6-phosphate deacetylase
MLIETAGFLDLQVNGFAGVDFNDPALNVDALRTASDALRSTGVTQFLPTLITSSLDCFSACAGTIARSEIREIAGIHMEGPYISAEDGARGAHPREDVILPSIDDFKRRQDAAEGRILLVTLAPELPGAARLTEFIASTGVRVAIGHTAASAEEIATVIRAGASLSTHLGNGCAQMLPRHPNHLWEQLASDELDMSLIVDGHHLPASTVKAMIRAKGASRTILVTDAIAAAGCAPGRYFLAGVEVELNESGRVAVPGEPNLAGSALAMNDAVGRTVRFTGLSLEEVLRMASTNPLRYLGIPSSGRLLCEWEPLQFALSIREVIT